MQIAFFDDFRPGVVRDGQVFDLTALLYRGTVHTPQEALESLITRFEELKGEIESVSQGGNGIPLERVRLRAPVPKPTQLLCSIRSYHEEGRQPEEGLFLKSPMSIVGTGDTVRLPSIKASVFHFEPELALVIGRGGSGISTADAMSHIFGYTGFLDVSAREAGASFHMRKSYDTFGPMGPVLVTADEIPDPLDLRVRLWVNDRERQNFSTSSMATVITRQIELASTVSTLSPGDVIATGTYHLGLGPIKEGDAVRMEIERIGQLSVTVEDPMHRTWDV